MMYSFLVDGESVTVPVTPGQNFTPEGTYVIELKHKGESLYLVASKYMSWFRGIATRKGLRFEIDEGKESRGPKIMKNSVSLGHNGMYIGLLPGEHIAHLKLGYQRLLWAFFILPRLGEQKKGNSKEERIAFTIMALMFFEGPRFVDVCDFFKRVLTQDANTELGGTNQKQIGDWCDYGTRFYTEKGDERAEPILISHNTSEDVKAIPTKLRIMCRSTWDKWMEDKGDQSKSNSSSRSG